MPFLGKHHGHGGGGAMPMRAQAAAGMKRMSQGPPPAVQAQTAQSSLKKVAGAPPTTGQNPMMGG